MDSVTNIREKLLSDFMIVPFTCKFMQSAMDILLIATIPKRNQKPSVIIFILPAIPRLHFTYKLTLMV